MEGLHKKLHHWHEYNHFMSIFNLNYSYRVKTEAIFNNRAATIFEFFVLDDPIFDQFYLFDNFWRDTLLMHHFNDSRV